VLYGAGGDGRAVARHLTACGVKVLAFIDADAAPGQWRDGIPAYTLSDWAKAAPADCNDVLVSIRNASVNVAPIFRELRSAGFSRVLTMVDYASLFPVDPQFPYYWLAPASSHAEAEPRIAAARALLADDESLRWFDALVRLRREGDYLGLPEPNHADQYVPAFLRWTDPMRLIDCGAFDGDTLALMVANGYQIEAAAAFEPDPSSYAKLTERYRDLDAVFLPCGVSDATGMVRFSGGRGLASAIDDAGTDVIQCVAIDDVLPAFAPNLIKMDVEGAEPAALRGAEATLRKHRPGLAISIYHAPDHLWEIPLWLDQLGLGYRMLIRGHGYNGYDTVLYALPNA
jgi:FkbM family methyltransferase